MAKTKKFDYRVVQEEAGWAAQIIRKVTAKQSKVSKSQSGFSSESEAKEWAETELKAFLKTLEERKKRRSE